MHPAIGNPRKKFRPYTLNSMMMINPSLRADEIKLWLTPTNQSLVIVCTQARLTPDRISFPKSMPSLTLSLISC